MDVIVVVVVLETSTSNDVVTVVVCAASRATTTGVLVASRVVDVERLAGDAVDVAGLDADAAAAFSHTETPAARAAD